MGRLREYASQPAYEVKAHVTLDTSPVPHTAKPPGGVNARSEVLDPTQNCLVDTVSCTVHAAPAPYFMHPPEYRST